MKLVKSVIILLAGFLSTACIDETLLSINRSYYTDNVAIQDIDAEVVVRRYKMGYYEDLGNNHEHTDEHYHDQNDGMQFGDELQQFRSLYLSVNLSTITEDGEKHVVGVADKHRFIAEVNGVRFELFRNYGLQTSGSVKSVYLAIHSLLIDSRYYPQVFFNAGVDGSYQNPIDLDDVVIRLMIEREDGSVSEARITNATNQDATLSESAVDRYVSKLVSSASSPSITHVDYIGSTDTAQQPEPFTLNAHGDYQAALVSANEGWANWNAFQPHNILHTDIYCNAFSAVSRYYDGSLLVPNGAASDAEIIIDYNPETIESRPCTTDVVRFFKTTQNSTWVEEQNDFSSLSVLYNTTTSVKQIDPR